MDYTTKQATQYRDMTNMNAPTLAGGMLGAGNAPADDSASRIRDSIGSTEQLLSVLQETIERMERRLDTVLTPQPPSTSGQVNKNPTPIGSHVVGRLEILNEGFAHAIQRLIDLTRRVEV